MCFFLVSLGRIASSKMHTQFKARVQNHTLFEIKIAEFSSLFFDQNGQKTPYHLGPQIPIWPITPQIRSF